MPAATAKQVGLNIVLKLDPAGANVDLSADGVSLDTQLQRTMIDSNQLGFDVQDQIHGAWDLTATVNLDRRKDSGLYDLFKAYVEGEPKAMTLLWRGSSAAVGATNREWAFTGGKLGSLPGPAASWNSTSQWNPTIRFTDAGISADGANFTSVRDGTTVFPLSAD